MFNRNGHAPRDIFDGALLKQNKLDVPDVFKNQVISVQTMQNEKCKSQSSIKGNDKCFKVKRALLHLYRIFCSFTLGNLQIII
jgi:hypothetical protein